MIRLVLITVLLCVAEIQAAPVVEKNKPNILFIIIDTLRSDHAGCYGYNRPTTPELDRLASEGILFQSAIASSSWTIPSIMSIFTALDPSLHGVTSHSDRLGPGFATFAGSLKQGGYQTAGIVSTPSLVSQFGFNTGFDFYDDISIPMNVGMDLSEQDKSATGYHLKETSEPVTRLAVGWLRNRRDAKKPFMLFLHYFDPHVDYQPPAEYAAMFTDPSYAGSRDGTEILSLKNKLLTQEDKKHIVDLYDGEIRYTDDQIARLFEELRSLDLYSNTLIVVTSDHGEEFWDHGSLGHGHTLYEEQVKVPLVIKLPGGESAGTVCTNLISHVDLMPTILARVDLPISSQCQGAIVSWEEKQTASECRMETDIEGSIKAIRTYTHKYIKHFPSDAEEAFRLSEDPGEKKNLAESQKPPADFREVLAHFDKWAEILKTAKPGVKITIDDELSRKLRSLGYVK